jgi:uncharacterized membrane protein YuzA (DUF378 family)
MKKIDVIAAVLLVVGGLNWGLFGLFQLDLVATIFGGVPLIATVVYTLVGASALYQVASLTWIQRRWNVSPRPTSAH